MKLTIEDSDGYSIMNDNDIPQDIYKVLVDYTEREFTSDPVAGGMRRHVYGIENVTGELVFNTTRLDMRKGKYKIILEDSATEVEDDVTITVEKWYLKMECSEEVIKDWGDIVITIHSSFYDENVTVIVAPDIPGWKNKTLILDEEGKKRVRIPTKNETVHYGRYEITVKGVFKSTKFMETRYVLVKEGKTSLKVPETATVGDIVHIEGTSDYGYLAVFVIDDVYKSDAAIVDDKFGWYWDTACELDGYYGIEVFILDDRPTEISIGDEVSLDWQREKGVDASASIFLNYPAVSMTVSKCIAKGDPVVISGTAAGADHIYVIVFNYRGDVVFPYTENMSAVNAVATPVEESKWTETLSALDFGEYTVIALDKGEDGRTRAINENGEWEIGGESKTLEQRVAILMDAITFVGSDDLYVKACFSVSAPEVILTVPETVEIGTAISVNAKTNMREGEKAFISLSQNSSIIKKNSPEVKNGSVTASIDTSGLRLLPGKYNVAVDISGRASDEKEVVLVEKGKEPIPKNESLTEPALEAVEEANETVGEGEFLNETGEGGEEVQKKIPVHVCDLVIAVVVASAILAVARRRRGRRRR